MNQFVYVVCGGKEYLDQLNFSLKFLKHFSRYPVIVVTDCSRNEIPIQHDRIIHVDTPAQLTHHQAHLYLETRLPDFLDLQEEDVCCYLDSDMIAINTKINDVFANFSHPVRFAKDHCRIDYFSVGVMNCQCLQDFEQRKSLYYAIVNSFPVIDQGNASAVRDGSLLRQWFDIMKAHPWANFLTLVNYLFNRYIRPANTFQFKEFTFDKSRKTWHNAAGNLIDFDFRYHNKKICEKFRLTYDGNSWIDESGRKVQPELPHCHHLRTYLNNTYALNIPEHYQHWNGGVFLFKKSSAEFMHYWHQLTMHETVGGNIKPYDDQGTLIASAFKFGIQDAPPLPVKYNFITDFDNPQVKFDQSKGYTYNNFKTIFHPGFLHVYNHWGDDSWSIWQSVVGLGRKLKIID